ncbi:FolB domain-containing protein [Paraburkholderia sp. CNPSo 3157]|uniref:FolB domain-containing protein n=1 Tax=Paraburkholderia franconis TaxID=2654983 RepID=A0A7X1NF78_9BURK|nr:dihydroneopterin aldolase [Paraburkholderia franconis]MPW20363.1 FolB domain-containing protein [Paraburkholderia franconis]
MKPFEEPLVAYVQPLRGSHGARGRGWRVFIDELVVSTRIGIHAHEHLAPQPVVIDASLAYRCEPSEEGSHAMIDYERYCNRVSEFLATKPHTRMLETLAVEIAQLSFDEWPALDALTLCLHKPKIREGTKRIGVELDWTRADYDMHRAASAAGR